ncbi:MAG: hypothetical protein R3211_01040 [Balneolaceae bacterium]|nr:hypothetical protein [Balneolaceae bacterium]
MLSANMSPFEGGLRGMAKTNAMTKKFDHLGYNKELKELARQLRKNSTKAEVRLWTELLRGGKIVKGRKR